MNALLCSVGEHPEPVPAVAVFYWPGEDRTQPGLCADDLKCTIGGCRDVPVILDPEYDELWCANHRDDFDGDHEINGPEIVLVDSDRYREVTASA